MKIKKDDLLISDFLKQIKDAGEFEYFYPWSTNAGSKECLRVKWMSILGTRSTHQKAKILEILEMGRQCAMRDQAFSD